jgi:tetratricopeptide (TPR) repeat protein
LDNGGETGRKAKRYLETKLPHYPATTEAVQLNIKAFNSRFMDQQEAERTWLECIQKYPKFEWAYSNLGSLYVSEGKYKEAEDLLNKALAINPSYVNAWLHLAECKRKENDQAGMHACVKKALELDPDDQLAKLLDMMPAESEK